MDIYLSVNNREEVMRLPVMPATFTVSKPQNLGTFEVAGQKDLQLIGIPKLKTIAFESFFPIEGHDYYYLRNTDMWGWDYVYTIDKWVERKLPIRLIITGTDINMAVALSDFEYTVKSDGDIWYEMEFEEFNLLGAESTEADASDTISNEEEDLTVTQYEELKESIEYLTSLVNELANPMIYNYIDDNMPSWAKAAVQAAIDAGVCEGTGDGDLGLSYTDLKTLVFMYRCGLF